MGQLGGARAEVEAVTQRAEWAEARRHVWEQRARMVVRERRALRVERDALRKDAARWYEHITLKAAIDAALAVQPTTGDKHE